MIGQIISHYRIVERLGGGMGVVYRLRTPSLVSWVENVWCREFLIVRKTKELHNTFSAAEKT
jgi:hypothetical protein